MRRIAATLALALCVLGCTDDRTELLTGSGHWTCGWAGPGPVLEGLLLPDPEHGTAIKVEGGQSGFPYSWPSAGSIVPVLWPEGYTGQRPFGGEVEVLDTNGKVVARTGGRYALSPPVAFGDNPTYRENGPWPACDPPYELAQGETVLAPLPTLLYDLAAVKASFWAECDDPFVLEVKTCEQLDVDAMTGVGTYLTVPTTILRTDRDRAEVICAEGAQLALDGEPLGYESIFVLARGGKRLATCTSGE